MREIINYMLEANLALLLFLAAYKLLLTHETNFSFMRFFMLAAIFISLSFPLMRFNNIEYAALPSVGSVVPSYWLPEIVIGTNAGQQVAESTNAAYDFWQVAGWIYGAGTFLFLCWLAVQLTNVLRTIRQASTSRPFIRKETATPRAAKSKEPRRWSLR